MLPRFVHTLLIAAWMAMVGLFAPIPAALADSDAAGFMMLADAGQLPDVLQAERSAGIGVTVTDNRPDGPDSCADCHSTTTALAAGQSTAGLPPPEWIDTVLRSWSLVPRAPPWLRYC